MMHFRFLKAATIAAFFVSFALCASLQAQQHPLRIKHVPDLVRNGQASAVGQVEAERQLHLVISLPLRNEDVLNTVLQQIYDPQSPNFHHYLKPQQFTDSFAPTQQDYDTAVAWAKAKGLQVTATPANRRLIEVDAPAGTINRAFNVLLKTYQDTRHARTFHAPDREPTVDLAVPLLAVSGLDDATPPHTHLKKKEDDVAQTSNGITENVSPPENNAITASGPGNTYLPSDMRAAYYGSGPLDGTGQTVAIFSFDDYPTGDLAVYYSHTGMSTNVPVTNVYVDGYDSGCFGFNSNGTINYSICNDAEQILDIVNVIGMAPGLSGVQFYVSNSAVAALNQMASDDTASVITSSWGGGDFGPACDPVFLQFQAQGQTFLNATGDDGEFNSSTYDPPSVDANILQVGGTDLITMGAGGPWSSETGWADSGGGFMPGVAIPTWQQTTGVITATNKGSTTLRNTPDVAAEANFDNTTVVSGKFSSGYGGTSYATPRWAGFIALVNQQSVANGNGTVGFVNPTLYNLGLGTTYASNFHDITSGLNKSTAGTGAGFPAVAGYDLITGWGSPNAALIASLAGTAAGDYSLAASPNPLTIAQGTNGTTRVTVSDIAGFTGAVSLVAGSLPAGVTASFSPASTTGSSVLTLTASNTAALGQSTVTITGTSGSLTHTASLPVTITAGADYSLSASPTAVTAVQGAAGTSRITITPINSFSGSVALSASGLPAGVTASFSPASATTTSTLTLTASSVATLGQATVTITGTSGSLTHTTTVTLTVAPAPDYSLAASPSSVSVVQGTAGTSTVTVTPINSFTGSVALSATGLPAGVTASFSPATATTSSVLTLTASSTAAVGPATVTITGVFGSLTHTATVALTVAAAPDYSLSASAASVVQGASGTSTITVTPTNGFSASVALSASGLPAGITASFSPASATTSSVLTLMAASTATAGVATITVTGVSGSVTHTASVALTVTPAPDYSLSASPVNVVPGGSGNSTVTVAGINGFNGLVGLSASGLPAGVTASFSPANAATSSTLTLTASSAAAAGVATVTISGTSGSLTHSTTLLLTVQDYSLSASAVILGQGNSGTSTVVVTDISGFNGLVNLVASGLPAGVTASFSPSSTTGSSMLTLTVATTAAVGPAAVTIMGTSGSLTHTATLALTVVPPQDFTLSTTLNTMTLMQGTSGSRTISIGDINHFSGLVNLSVSGLPDGVTGSFTSVTGGNSGLTLTASSTAVVGSATVTITGTSGNLTHSFTLALTVTGAPDYVLTPSLPSMTLGQGGKATNTLTVVDLYGFAKGVTLSVGALPAGVTASLSPSFTGTTSTLTLTASSTAALGPATVTITGTGGGPVNHTATIALNVTDASDYSLSAAPVSVVQGASGTSTITVTPINGFSGSVALSASGLPAGVTASFNPASATTSSTLTLTAASTAALGTATVTITGTSGSLTHTTTVALTVTPAPDYSLSALPVSAVQGASGASIITVTGINNFSGSVSLSASGLPAGVTASFSPASATTSSTLTLTASSTATVGLATVTIIGTSGSLTHTTTVALTVVAAPDYSLSSVPVSIVQGASGTSAITVAGINNFSGSVSLSASGLPAGVTASFSPASATTSSTLTLTASSTATVGVATVTITGTSGSLTHTTTVALTVVAAPDYSLSALPVSVVQGASGNSTVTVTDLNGFSGSVVLSASGLPSGVTAAFSPATVTSGSTLTLTASNVAPAGPATVTITGTSGSLTHNSTLALTVVAAPDYSLLALPVSIVQGASGTSAITVVGINGFSGSVALSASGLPAGITASFSPASATTSSVLTLMAASTATAGVATITVTGVSGSLTHTTMVALTVVAAPDYSLSALPVSVVPGGNGNSTVTVAGINGFNGLVSLSASGLPAGVTASFSPANAATSSTLTLTASSAAAAGVATVTISGTSGSLTHSTTLLLTVQDYSLSASAVILGQGNSGTSTVVVTDISGFNGLVNLVASGLPAGVTASFSPSSTTGSSMLTLTVATTAAVGPAAVTIMGTSGSLTHTATLALTVVPPQDFTLSTTLNTMTLMQGTSGSRTISIGDINHFSGLVNLSVSGLPDGVTGSFTSVTGGNSGLTLTASSTAAVGSATVTITGTSGNLTHSFTLALTVTGAPDYVLTPSLPSMTLGQGGKATNTLTVVDLYGFAKGVTLSVGALPAGVTASLSPSFTGTTSTLTLTASSTAALGPATVTITGTGGGPANHTATIALNVTATQ